MAGETDSNRLKASIDSVQRYFDRKSNLWIGGVIVFILIFFNVLPFIVIIFSSFYASGSNILSEFTTENWMFLYQKGVPLIANTLIFSTGSAVLTVVLSMFIAWVIARTNAPYRKVYYYLCFVPFFLPPILYEEVWIYLLGNNGIYAYILDLDTLYAYSMGGMIFVQGVRLLPIGMIFMIPLFGNINTAMEEASKISGAGVFTTFRNITAPLILPGVLVVFIFSFMINLEAFRVPLIIGLPAGENVLAVEIYREINEPPIRYGVAMVQAVVLVSLAIPILYFYKRALGKANKYATVSGQGYMSEPVDIGNWRYVLSFIVGAIIFLTVIVPSVMILYISLLPYYMPPHTASPETILSSLSLEAYVNVLEQSQLISAFVNSLTVATITATLLTGIGIFLGWVINKSSIEFKRLIDYLAFFPIGVPGVSLALGVIVVWTQFVPFAIYGTLLIFFVAFFTKLMPSNLRIMETGVLQVDGSLLESAMISGASIPRTLWTILVPVIFKLTRISWLMSFAFVMTEMPIVMMLRSPDTEMVSSILYRLISQGHLQTEAFAFGVMVTVFLFVVTLLLHVTNYANFGVFSG